MSNPSSPFDFQKGIIKAIEPPERGRDTYRDTRQPRLYLRVTTSGVKSFYFVRKVAGRTEWVWLGRFPEMTVSAARSRAESEGGKFTKGGNPAQERRQQRKTRKSEPTLVEVWKLYRAAYLRGETRGGGRSIKTLDSEWTVWLADWKDTRISAITPAMVERLRDRAAAKRSKQTVNKIIGAGRKLYTFAAKRARIGYTGPNPFALVDKLETGRTHRKQRLRKSQVSGFFSGLQTVTPTMRDFFMCCLCIGARAGNIKSMRWRDLDLDSGVWTIPHTKTGDSLEVSLAEPVVELLKERRRDVPAESEWVFPARSKSGHLVTYRKAWLQVCGHAGIEDLRVHDLRRTLSSWAQEAGVNVALVQAQLGHSDPRMTLGVYTSIAGTERRLALESTIKAMMEAAATETKH